MVTPHQIDHIMFQMFEVNDPRGFPTEYEIDSELKVNVPKGHVDMRTAASQIPIKFGYVAGYFRAERKGLVSLMNTPDACDQLDVSDNKITSLMHVTTQVRDINLDNNSLTNLQHMPASVQVISVSNNPLTSLEGLPEQGGYKIRLTYSDQLPLLRLVHAGQVHVGHAGSGYARLTPFEPVNSIINKYVGEGKPGALKCAAELIRAGFKDNARW